MKTQSVGERLKEKCLVGQEVTPEEALLLFEEAVDRPYYVMALAAEIREHFKGKRINLCAIVNAKSGRCSEDCAFCAQSAHYRTSAPVFPLKGAEEILKEARMAVKAGAEMFGIVTSGKKLRREKEWSEVLKAVEMVASLGMKPCASLGILEPKRARQLKDAGLFRYHHNLETARSFFTHICTTHAYEEDLETLVVAREAGLSVCSGGIFGMGEGISHRIELALTLRELKVDSVPLNFLNPIKGTPLYRLDPLPPLEIIASIAVMRFLLPDRDLRLCGGKEKNLRQLLPLAVIGGANAIMTGNYLTTEGRNPALDHELIQDLGLKATKDLDFCRCECTVENGDNMS